ncbi:hypothetical protein B0A81_01600 [Flavobacterium plurextorum]|uniref:GIY-YIG domain-containing protein n=1 Tax=Flavobacterium plurextorum TaxID=1114867 RepID=A0ABX4CZU0_9FLAO|nr:hypothetical protein B0A81_01600 [Flavobacterium plurextorum]
MFSILIVSCKIKQIKNNSQQAFFVKQTVISDLRNFLFKTAGKKLDFTTKKATQLYKISSHAYKRSIPCYYQVFLKDSKIYVGSTSSNPEALHGSPCRKSQNNRSTLLV